MIQVRPDKSSNLGSDMGIESGNLFKNLFLRWGRMPGEKLWIMAHILLHNDLKGGPRENFIST